MATSSSVEKKGHVCPPSNAIHPADRWESLFVYSFICKFTNLRSKVEGLESPMDFEEALMSHEPNDILTRVLGQFIVNLKPQTRNLSTDQISMTVQAVLAEYCKTAERTVFWDDDRNANVDPFEGTDVGFFATNWDFKLKILRQLVELQLCHAPDIKATIDRAWGVVHNKHKKNQQPAAPPEPSDPKSRQNLTLHPIGQDSQRKRFWVADDSPRLYTSTNPWKITATFQTIASTREEYVDVIENLKANAPPELKKGQKRTKPETSHLNLIAELEGRLEKIDAEQTRVQKVRRRIEQKRTLLAQAELRTTRTRRQTQKPDYVYNNEVDSEDDGGDEYTYQEDGQDEEYDQESLHDGSRRGQGSLATRRSARTSTRNSNAKRESSSDSWLWRGERRSTRLGRGEPLKDSDRPQKRARTEESVTSDQSSDPSIAKAATNGVKIKASGAAALKPTEIAMEQIAGKKRSKFWVYAVEPVPSSEPPSMEVSSNVDDEAMDTSEGPGNSREFTPPPVPESSNETAPVIADAIPAHS
ncbi:hypothetical protein BJ165DRAFT_1431032 [Panaeolus papilionaceus]|nr:hypothetical protein BJ165DRAFT_1431032 [Panaeolus papilionaceus]